MGVSKETAKNISQKTPSKNGNVSLPSFLESLTVANISGEVFDSESVSCSYLDPLLLKT